VVVLGQVPGDGVGSGLQAGGCQLVAELEDQVDGRGGDGGRAGVRTSRPRLERGLSLRSVAGNELAHPALRDAVAAGDLGLLAVLEDDGGDDQAGL